MKTRVIGGAAALLVVIGLGALNGVSGEERSRRKTYIIETVVPDEILVIREPEDDKNPAKDLVAGLREISEKYRIEKTEAITQFVGGGTRPPASATEALLVYVKPKA